MTGFLGKNPRGENVTKFVLVGVERRHLKSEGEYVKSTESNGVLAHLEGKAYIGKNRKKGFCTKIK